MRNTLSLLSFLVVILLFHSCKTEAPNNQETSEIDTKVNDLLAQMTLEEKVGQMTQISINVFFEGEKLYQPTLPVQLQKDSLQKFIVDHHIGSIFGCARFPFEREEWKHFITDIQDIATTETRLKIPVIYGIDAIHGVTFTKGSTIFPQQIGMAATWNPELIEEAGRITAYETKASGQPWNFAPVLGLGRQPLWSRFFETFGEDVYLTRTMGKALIKGMEGNDISDPNQVAACMKHYIGYSIPTSGKDRTAAMIPERQLREYFLPPFEDAIATGVHTVMINSGEINGIPVHCNKYLLTEVLRNELGFEGVAVTDFKDIKLLHESHKVAASYKEAVKMAINAGIDMSMTPMDVNFSQYLIELVNEGEVPMARIDESVFRILKLKYQLGLFENPVPDFDAYPNFACKEHQDAALKTAIESITLLKNNNLLPLKKSQQILVTGPTANAMTYLNGPWTYTWQGNDKNFDPEEKNTIYEAIKQVNSSAHLVEGTTITKDTNLAEAISVAQTSDVIIACLGETPGVEEKGNIVDLNFEKAQINLIKQLAKTGKPIVLIINSGRPRILNEIEELVDAIVFAYLPGNEGGDAIAKLLFGEENFSGKLPFTYPKYTGSLWSHYDHKNTDLNIEGEIRAYNPLYEFGFGLSYTEFNYANLSIDKENYTKEDSITLQIEVSNIGEVEGKEVVQLYISDQYATITPSAKRLRAYRKINLTSGETKLVEFKIAIQDLAFVGLENEWIVEPGGFTIQIGNQTKEFVVN